VVQKDVSILLSSSFHIKLIQAIIFQVNHTAPKFYFSASMDEAARYSVQVRIKIVETYFGIK